MSGEEHPHHRKKNSQVIVTTGGIVYRPPSQMQGSATIVSAKEKENDRLMNKNYRIEEPPEDKSHRRQQSTTVSLHQHFVQPVQQPLQPPAMPFNNPVVNFKGLARNNAGQPTIGTTSTTPTNVTLPQSNSSNLATVNKEFSRVREKKLDEKPLTAVHLQSTNVTHTSSVAPTRKTEIRIPEKVDPSPPSAAKENTKEKPRPSIKNNDKKQKKKVNEPDDFECNEELEQTHPTRSARAQLQPAVVVCIQPQQGLGNPSLRQARFELSAPVSGMFKNLR